MPNMKAMDASQMTHHSRQDIIEMARTSPKSCRMTDDRLNMLIAAKAKRMEKVTEKKRNTGSLATARRGSYKPLHMADEVSPDRFNSAQAF